MASASNAPATTTNVNPSVSRRSGGRQTPARAASESAAGPGTRNFGVFRHARSLCGTQTAPRPHRILAAPRACQTDQRSSLCKTIPFSSHSPACCNNALSVASGIVTPVRVT